MPDIKVCESPVLGIVDLVDALRDPLEGRVLARLDPQRLADRPNRLQGAETTRC